MEEEKDLKQQLEDLKDLGYKNNILWCIWSGFLVIVTSLGWYMVGKGKGREEGFAKGCSRREALEDKDKTYTEGKVDGYIEGLKFYEGLLIDKGIPNEAALDELINKKGL